ncbi:hypothetical protein SAMN05216337_11028 [Bradyrhizobium brasilense]|uniref:Uncharacterized protein n=1 Tax=Bradyrhizobium brasilense TaxID=1419277 RepID=A0A1G7QQ96_9BRAD|nr:hypothetical protein SAMN05216337_11028 [Bradyrhizobium brasilense]
MRHRTQAAYSGAVWATHYASFSSTSLHNGNEMVAASRELPVSCYGLEVDGRLEAEFTTRDGARPGREESKKRFPCFRSGFMTRRRMRPRRSTVHPLRIRLRSSSPGVLGKGARRHQECRRRYHCPVPGYPFNRSRRGTRSRVPPSASLCSRSCGCHFPLKRCAARTPAGRSPLQNGISSWPRRRLASAHCVCAGKAKSVLVGWHVVV